MTHIKRVLRAPFEAFLVVVQFLRIVRNLLDRKAPEKSTPWGFTLAGHEAMASGAFEPDETAVVRKLLEDVDVLVNVGANVGYYCCHALSLGKPVIAIEPVARNLHYLLTNIRNNGWSENAEIFPVAVGGGTNVLDMWGGGTGASLIKGWASIPENYVTQVPVLTLDRILGETLRGRRALILVDVEGAEYMVLQGATRVLDNQPSPIWMMEITVGEHQPEGVHINPKLLDTFDVFYCGGYRAFSADALAIEITRDSVLKASQGRGQLGTHNFVFKRI